MRALAIAAVPLLLLGAAPPAAAEAKQGWPTPEILARQFERIAFTSEYGGQYRAGRLIRWQGPIRASTS